jgi:putative transposase
VSKVVVIATGVSGKGRREVLGFDVGVSEDEVLWRGFLTSPRTQGLAGVRLVISDQHAGLVAALRRSLRGAAHQRCRVHLSATYWPLSPVEQEMVPAAFRTVFAYADRAEACEHYDQVSGTFAEHFAKASALMAGAKEEILAFSAFPREHWRQIWPTSQLERLNTKLKKPWPVVGISPTKLLL